MSKIERFISVVIPVSNPGLAIGDYVDRLLAVLETTISQFEVIVIDDGCGDDTAAIVGPMVARNRGLRLLVLARSFGRNIAVEAGLDSAIGDYVIVLDPATDPPALIPDILQVAMKGADIVYGVDSGPPRRRWHGALAARLFRWYAKRYLGLEIRPNMTALRCFSRRVVNALTRTGGAHRYLRVADSVLGYRIAVFDYQRVPSAPSGGQGFAASLSEAISLTVDNSPHPLRIFSVLGLGVAAINLFYILYVLTTFLLRNEVAEGWTTLSLQVSGLFMCVILILSAMSEYIGHLIHNLQGRPSYYLREEISGITMIGDERLNIADGASSGDISQDTG